VKLKWVKLDYTGSHGSRYKHIVGGHRHSVLLLITTILLLLLWSSYTQYTNRQKDRQRLNTNWHCHWKELIWICNSH